MQNKIDSERFNALQELSQIEMRLSDARVAFENFKKTEEEYLKQREKDVSDKLDKFISTLSDAYETFTKNKDTFETIKNIVVSFAEKATTLTAEVRDISIMLSEKITNADLLIDTKMSKLTSDSLRIAEERGELKKSLEEFNVRLRALSEAEIKLNNEKIAFEKKWNELNN